MLHDEVDEQLLDYKGLKGIFYHDTTREQLVSGIRTIFEGDCWFSRRLMSRYLAARRENSKRVNGSITILTKKEQMILRHVAEGVTNQVIAKRLCVSVHTVKTHVYNIFRKIGVSNRVQAINWMADLGTDQFEPSMPTRLNEKQQSFS
jgi:LuxR family transcriptional regulator of csgAB operon